MKKINMKTGTLLLLTAIVSMSVNAATVWLPSNIGTSAFKGVFEQAVVNAGDGGTVMIPNGVRYTTDKPIFIERRVLVKGNGNRNNIFITATKNMNHMVYLSRNGISLKNITFDGKKKCNNVIHTFKTQGHNLLACRVLNAKFSCVGNVSGWPLNTTLIQGGEYKYGVYNIQILNRIASKRVDAVGRTILEYANISEFGNTGVQLDCANDGKWYITDMRNHLVRHCTITGNGQFAVGTTYTKNHDYQNNVLTCKDDPIHIEFRSSNVDSSKNKLTTTARSGGQPIFSCISLMTGDKLLGTTVNNPTPNDHANRVLDSKHYDNILLGRSFFGTWATESTDCKFIRTDHRSNQARYEKIFLCDWKKSRYSFGGSHKSQGSKRTKVEGCLGVKKSDMFYATNVGHTINQPN